MKKFFSLVLALVMALSLTTVAWGAVSGAGTEADPYQVSTEAELTEAVGLSGSHIKLTASFSVASKVSITKDTVIDGAGFTLTYTGTDRAIDVAKETNGADLTISNLTVTAASAERGINYNTNGNLTLTNVTVNGYPSYAINLPGSSDGAVVTITGGSITGLIALNVWGSDVTVNANNAAFVGKDPSNVESYNAVKLCNNGTDSADGSVINITGGSITAEDDSAVYSNATTTGVINISSTTTLSGNDGGVNVAVINYPSGYSYSFPTMADANAFVEAQLTANPSAAITVNVLETAVNSGESFDKLAGVTYSLPADADMVTLPNGDVAVVTPATFSGTTAITSSFKEDGTYYVLYNGIWDEVTYVPADDNGDGTGNVAYFDGDLADYIICKKNDDDALKLTSGFLAGDKLLGYVKVGVPNYTDVANKVAASLYVTCTTDANAKGYLSVDPYGVKTYYEDNATSGTDYILVGTELKRVDVQTDAVMGGHALIKYKAAAKDAAKTVFEYKCVICGAKFDGTTTKAAGVNYTRYTFDKATTGAAYTAAGYDMTDVETGVLWLVKTASFGGGSVTTDKVQSADTFDAGIAMYVGMSVMAAAGSVVVLKKRED